MGNRPLYTHFIQFERQHLQDRGSVLKQNEFLRFLDGQTHPAEFRLNGANWVVRYMKDPKEHPRHSLRLASEFVGYQIAKFLGVPVPQFQVVQIAESFENKCSCHGKNLRILKGPATACKLIQEARSPDLDKDSLDEFWEAPYYLDIVARARTADTWTMNFDRRKKGNVLLTGSQQAPQVWFVDFDQSFLSKNASQVHGYRLHWTEEEFRSEWLKDEEVLSGFDGKGGAKCESAMHSGHFQNVLMDAEGIADEKLERLLSQIPIEWEISEKGRKRWLCSFLQRRGIVIRNIRRQYAGDN